MKKKIVHIGALIISVCAVLSAPVYAENIDDMSLEELKEAYLQLESENKELRSELGKLTGEDETVTEKSEDGTVSYESKVVVLDLDTENQFYNAAIEIKNTGTSNLDLGGYSTLSLEDADGNLLAYEDSTAVCAMPNVIRPGETGYIFGNGISSGDASGDCKVKFDDSYFSSTTFDPEEFSAVQTSVQDEDYSSVIGRIDLGDSDYSGEVNILCLFYDKDGNLILVSGAYETVSPDSDNNFQIYSSGTYGLNIDSYKIFVQSEDNNLE